MVNTSRGTRLRLHLTHQADLIMTNQINRILTLQASDVAHQPLELSEEELEGVVGGQRKKPTIFGPGSTFLG
jgi:hypothetical protein